MSGAPPEPCKRTAMRHEPTRAKPPPSAASGGISMGHQCCAIATRPPSQSILTGAATFWSRNADALGIGASRCRLTQHGGAIMGNVVNDFLLFSCMALFVTGIVLAAASLLI